MKVTLIDYTGCGNPDPWHAVNILLFTKSTRLNMSPSLLDDIKEWPEEKKLSELAYIASTIPSSWEFVCYTFMIEGVSRAYTHQQVRTRNGSYAQQSLRVVDASKLDFVMPDRIAATASDGMGSAYDHTTKVIDNIMWAYGCMIKDGVAAEDARSILPTNIATNIVAKFNLRTMSELAKSRTGGRTQGEYIDVMNAMCDEIIKVHPWAEQFLFPKARDFFAEIESFAEREYAGDLIKKGQLLKIVDKMRKEV